MNAIKLGPLTVAVPNAAEAALRYGGFFDFRPISPKQPSAIGQNGKAFLHLLEPAQSEKVAPYLKQHGEGILDISFLVENGCSIVDRLSSSCAHKSIPFAAGPGSISVAGPGDMSYTFVESPVANTFSSSERSKIDIDATDHIAICLEPGMLDAHVAFCCSVLGFEEVFSDYVRLERQQGMNSIVVKRGTATLVLLEPIRNDPREQLNRFLENHRGAGVHHIAFHTENIVSAVKGCAARGLPFLQPPSSYYDTIADGALADGCNIDELRELGILVDRDEWGTLFQIFSQSLHERGTLFFELVHRDAARTFGNNNIRALYQAVERRRSAEGSS